MKHELTRRQFGAMCVGAIGVTAISASPEAAPISIPFWNVSYVDGCSLHIVGTNSEADAWAVHKVWIARGLKPHAPRRVS